MNDSRTLEVPVCPYCGSDNVYADSAVRFNKETQQWESDGYFYDKSGSCGDCESWGFYFHYVSKEFK